MAQKHLHELLMEDQEPFVLQNFIADRKKLKSHLQLKKQKPISKISIFSANFCKKSCLFSSPDPNKSPLCLFQTSYRNKNAVFLKIPSITALRIQKQSLSSKSRNRFWFFGSLFKKLRNHQNQTQKETSMEFQPLQNSEEIRFSSSPDRIETGFVDSDFCLCESPFRFVLQTGSSPDLRSPEFSPTTSPATSPTRHEDEDKKNYSVESLDDMEQVTEEEKEQSSPVSVLDPPFQDENDVEDDDDNFDESTSDYEKTKQRLLNKLLRFEQLAGLDKIELEKRMEEEGEDDNLENNEEETLRHVSKITKRVCMRKCETIESIVKDNFETEIEERPRSRGVVGGEAVEDIELEIYGLLVEEFAGELFLGAIEEL